MKRKRARIDLKEKITMVIHLIEKKNKVIISTE